MPDEVSLENWYSHTDTLQNKLRLFHEMPVLHGLKIYLNRISTSLHNCHRPMFSLAFN